MPKKIQAILLTASIAIIGFSFAGGLRVHASDNTSDASYSHMQVYSEVLYHVRAEYVEEPNMNLVTNGALHGMLESLDANSSYLSPEEYKVFKQKKTTGKASIGATVSKRYGYAAVVSVIPGGPADKAGVEGSDIFEAVEGKSTRDLSLAEIRTMLAGQPGSNVTVSVVRARRAEPQKVVITRDVVSIPAASDKIVDEGIGYIKVDAFNKGKSQEIANKVKSLQKQGAKKLILDLRNASEGDESEGIATANLFLNHGTITYLQGQKFPREAFNADPARDITTLPVVVMVNRGTAGPAEIVAAAVLENARGDVVGDKTFGDGSIQKTIDLPDGSALILSVAKYYTPNGKAIQDAAVTPNVLVAEEEDNVVPEDEEHPNAPDQEAKPKNTVDDQLKKAVEVLKSRAS